MWAAVLISLLLSACVLDAAPVVNEQASPIRAKRAFDLSCVGCLDMRLYEDAFENGNAARFNRFDELKENRRMRKFFEEMMSIE